MAITLNGLDVLEGTLVLPLRGNWRADLTVSSDEDITGTVTIEDGDDLVYGGVVVRGGLDGPRWHGRLVGGASGKLPNEITPQPYRAASAKLILSDLLGAIGEKLSAQSDAATLAYMLEHWFRFGTAEDAIEALVVDEIGANWRVQRDGSIWVGVDTFPELELENVIEEQSEERKVWTVATDRTDLIAGVTFEGQQVVQVTHRIMPGALRSEVSLGS